MKKLYFIIGSFVVQLIVLISIIMFIGVISRAESSNGITLLERKLGICYGFYIGKAGKYMQDAENYDKYWKKAEIINDAILQIAANDKSEMPKWTGKPKIYIYDHHLKYLYLSQKPKGEKIFKKGTDEKIAAQMKACEAIFPKGE